jgi:hypothetical protein
MSAEKEMNPSLFPSHLNSSTINNLINEIWDKFFFGGQLRLGRCLPFLLGFGARRKVSSKASSCEMHQQHLM